MIEVTKTFQIVHGKFDGRLEKGIKCLRCGRTSWNQNDVEKKYCGSCHQFHDKVVMVDR